jgi:hypothetical protein
MTKLDRSLETVVKVIRPVVWTHSIQPHACSIASEGIPENIANIPAFLLWSLKLYAKGISCCLNIFGYK